MKVENTELSKEEDEALYHELLGKDTKRSPFKVWRNPKDWKGTLYRFGYSQLKITDPKTGEPCYFTVKHKYIEPTNEEGSNWDWKLLRIVRSDKKKIAKARSLNWYNDYYEDKEAQ